MRSWLIGGLAGAAVLLGAVDRAVAQHVVGGGDPLLMTFAKARTDAVHMLELVGAELLPADVDADVRDFLTGVDALTGTTRILAMSRNLDETTLEWRDGDVLGNRCAATVIGRDARVIMLSIPRCRDAIMAAADGATETDAARLLIHETAHHFGIDASPAGEDKANRIALTVHQLWLKRRRGETPVWSEVSVVGAPAARREHTSVWTGDDGTLAGQLVVWGGCNTSSLANPEECLEYLNTGGRLTVGRRDLSGRPPVTDWTAMDATTAPLGRMHHTAVWTGDSSYAPVAGKMVIFGGCRGDDVACDQAFAVTACPGGNGATCSDDRRDHTMYDPQANQWSAVTSVGAPSPRVFHTAVWTDRQMIVWGGLEGYRNSAIPDRPLADGGILQFSAEAPQGAWSPIPPPPPDKMTPRYGHTAVWTGLKLYVWGGCEKPGIGRCTRYYDDGASYDPATGEWARLPATGLEARHEHSMVFDGRRIIVWGGRNAGGVLANGASYDVATGVWAPLPTQLPLGERGRFGHTAMWDGLQGRMIVWGGRSANLVFPATTLILARSESGPTSGQWAWSVAPTATAPLGRHGHSASFVRDALVVWGGFGQDGTFLGTGGVFNP